jgi:hypothetical protein
MTLGERLKVISYKIYRFRLNKKNKKREKKGQLPILDSRGYPFIASEAKKVKAVGFPPPMGKLFYIDPKAPEDKK